MTPGPSVIEQYRQLLEVSSRMLGLAREQEWEALVQCEAGYVVSLQRVRSLDEVQSLTDSEREQKFSLLEQILTQDAETRRVLESRREELSHLIGSSRRQQALGQAYQAGRGSIASRLRAVPTDDRP
ncbi:flagellar protein FliT [Salinicola halophyticus]|uniref:flagellar protein FliT n=1 Tax=Salinicola halophyticus TaxID=1808881 RepID=UPI000DA141D2|nr:flagellar protein FliT [Salinicola halophyticus]